MTRAPTPAEGAERLARALDRFDPSERHSVVLFPCRRPQLLNFIRVALHDRFKGRHDEQQVLDDLGQLCRRQRVVAGKDRSR